MQFSDVNGWVLVSVSVNFFWGSGFLSNLFGGGSNKEEALELYARAANLFKMGKQWGQAANTFCTIGRALEQRQLQISYLQKDKNGVGTCDEFIALL